MKTCAACHADVEDAAEKCPMCGHSEWKEDIEEQEVPEQVKNVIKTVFTVGNIFGLIMTIVVASIFIATGISIFKDMGGFEGKFSLETIFPLVFTGFGIFAIVMAVRSFLANRDKTKDL